MNFELTVTPSALGRIRGDLDEAASKATAAGCSVVSVAPLAFTKAASGAAAAGLTPAARGARAICQALAVTTVDSGERLADTAATYRAVEDEAVALARTIQAQLDGGA